MPVTHLAFASALRKGFWDAGWFLQFLGAACPGVLKNYRGTGSACPVVSLTSSVVRTTAQLDKGEVRAESRAV